MSKTDQWAAMRVSMTRVGYTGSSSPMQFHTGGDLNYQISENRTQIHVAGQDVSSCELSIAAESTRVVGKGTESASGMMGAIGRYTNEATAESKRDRDSESHLCTYRPPTTTEIDFAETRHSSFICNRL